MIIFFASFGERIAVKSATSATPLIKTPSIKRLITGPAAISGEKIKKIIPRLMTATWMPQVWIKIAIVALALEIPSLDI